MFASTSMFRSAAHGILIESRLQTALLKSSGKQCAAQTLDMALLLSMLSFLLLSGLLLFCIRTQTFLTFDL